MPPHLIMVKVASLSTNVGQLQACIRLLGLLNLQQEVCCL